MDRIFFFGAREGRSRSRRACRDACAPSRRLQSPLKYRAARRCNAGASRRASGGATQPWSGAVRAARTPSFVPSHAHCAQTPSPPARTGRPPAATARRRPPAGHGLALVGAAPERPWRPHPVRAARVDAPAQQDRLLYRRQYHEHSSARGGASGSTPPSPPPAASRLPARRVDAAPAASVLRRGSRSARLPRLSRWSRCMRCRLISAARA